MAPDSHVFSDVPTLRKRKLAHYIVYCTFTDHCSSHLFLCFTGEYFCRRETDRHCSPVSAVKTELCSGCVYILRTPERNYHPMVQELQPLPLGRGHEEKSFSARCHAEPLCAFCLLNLNACVYWTSDDNDLSLPVSFYLHVWKHQESCESWRRGAHLNCCHLPLSPFHSPFFHLSDKTTWGKPNNPIKRWMGVWMLSCT